MDKRIEAKLEEDIKKVTAECDKKIQALNEANLVSQLGETPVACETGYNTCVVVENVPVVDENVRPRLLGMLTQVFSRCGKIVDDGVYLPVDPETKKTPGFCIVQYVTEEQAKTAVKSLDKLALDKSHTFRVSPYTTLLAADNTPSEYTAPEIPLPEKPSLQHWLLDKRGCDQYIAHYENIVEVDWNVVDYQTSWNDPSQKPPEPYARKEDFPANFSLWSPRGTYLATAHPQGVQLFGGPPPLDKRLVKMDHPGVTKVDFSPNEQFLVTASSVPAAKGSKAADENKDEEPKTIIFHEIATGKKKLEFTGVKSSMWPVFRWSFDDKYFATVVKDKVQIYETSTMQLLGGTSIKVPGVKMFAWSPTSNVLAYFVPEDGNRPAGVSLLEVPSKSMLRQKNLFHVKDCRLHWHPSGAFLAVKVDRLSGNKKKGKTARVFFGKDMRASLLEQDPDMDTLQINRKVDELWEKATAKTKERYEKMALEDKERYAKELNFFTTFQIFRMEEKGIPIDEVEFDKKDPVAAFAWQPSGHLFAVVHGQSAKADVSVYRVGEKLELLKRLEQRQVSQLFWSPVNDFLVLANSKAPQGNLEFFNAELLETMGSGEHQNATDYQWDPRGRFFVSICSAWKHNVETGFYMWSFNGKLLAKVMRPKFYEFHWRPRPPTLLTAKDEKDVIKKMKDAQKEFEREDALRKRLEKREFYEQRNEQRSTFYANLQKLREEQQQLGQTKYASIAAKLKRKDDAIETIDEVVEVVVDEKITIL